MDAVPAPVRRIALSVEPRLVADALRRLMLDAGVEVRGPEELGDGPVDLAIVGGGAPAVAAEVLVELDDGLAGEGGGTVWYRDGAAPERVEGLAAVVDLVRGWGITSPHREG